jgi:hypothetical protein
MASIALEALRRLARARDPRARQAFAQLAFAVRSSLRSEAKNRRDGIVLVRALGGGTFRPYDLAGGLATLSVAVSSYGRSELAHGVEQAVTSLTP